MMNGRAIRRGLVRLIVVGLVLALAITDSFAQGNVSRLRKHAARAGLKKSDSVVKVTAKADKPDADGKQTVTVTLDIENGWHTYANPVGVKDFPGIETAVTITAKQKPESVTVKYPQGKFDAEVKGNVYEGKAVIMAVVKRAKGDTGPLQVNVKIQACNEKTCLLPATVKLTVD